MDPLILKMIHILSAILLFGTGLGTAFHGLASNLSRDVRAIAVGQSQRGAGLPYFGGLVPGEYGACTVFSRQRTVPGRGNRMTRRGNTFPRAGKHEPAPM